MTCHCTRQFYPNETILDGDDGSFLLMRGDIIVGQSTRHWLVVAVSEYRSIVLDTDSFTASASEPLLLQTEHLHREIVR